MVKVTRRLSLPLNTTGGPAAPEESSITAVDVETFNIGGSEELSEGKEVLPQVPSTPGTREKVVVSLLNPEIKPDDNMAGVIGDMVPSNLGAAGEKHFVTPKKTDELPQEYVMFKATGVTAEQISPGEGQVVEWVGGEAVPDEPLKRRVKRDQVTDPAVELKIMTKPKEGEAKEQAKVNVWVVWTSTEITATLQPQRTFANQPPIGIVTTVAGGLEFKHKIEPVEMLTSNDKPDLTGDKTLNPTSDDLRHPIKTTAFLKDGVTKKWDSSRQMRFKFSNPNNLPADSFGVPAPLINVPQFPTNPVEGNDDADVSDEAPPTSASSNDPYLPISQGCLWSKDQPSLSISKGNLGDVFVYHLQLQEFARVELSKKWYRIGDFTPWRAKISMRKIHHTPSNTDYWELDPQLATPFVLQSSLDDF